MWAAGSIALVGIINYFGPRHTGRIALIVALAPVLATLTIAIAAVPSLGEVEVTRPTGHFGDWWVRFTYIILAISGVEAIANMTGIMVPPIERTARRSIRRVTG